MNPFEQHRAGGKALLIFTGRGPYYANRMFVSCSAVVHGSSRNSPTQKLLADIFRNGILNPGFDLSRINRKYYLKEV